MSGLTISNINRAIINGEKKGVFVLPKGASGKVKLAKSTTPEKEVCHLERAL
jgi:linker histone H1 and H5 family